MSREKEYIINIAPIAWKRAGVKGKLFYDRQSHEKLATGLYLVQQHGNSPQFTLPVEVDVTFHLPLPQLKKNRERTQWHSKTPDIDNLQKFIFDAINDTRIIWKDDAIIASLRCKKIYDTKPRTHIIIRELE
jgi:Holliday junction resolvase RusA-like endonuclease